MMDISEVTIHHQRVDESENALITISGEKQ
jgi:hypothetical protein